MKYTKTAAALAMAGVAASPLAQADGHEGGPVVTLSGSIGINLESDESDETDDDWSFSGDDSTLNISASDTLSNGLTGYANYRLDSALSGSSTTGDSIHIGIRGDFGDIRIGEVDNAIEFGQVANDILVDVGATLDGGISYTNNFGGVTVGVNWSPAGNQSSIGVGAKYAVANFSFGAGVGTQGTEDDLAYSIGASYALGAGSIAIAWKDRENTVNVAGSEVVIDTRIDANGDPELFVVSDASLATVSNEDNEAFSLQASYSIAGIGLGYSYEIDTGPDDEPDQHRFDIAYGLGGGWGTSARYNLRDGDDDYRFQFSKSF